MNHLAHLLLSNHHEDLLIGNFITDFIKKPEEKYYSAAIQKGIQLHRLIDDFTDNHEQVKLGKKKLRTLQGKYAPVVLDICYDHLLAKNWDSFSSVPFDLFCKDTYKTLERRFDDLPDRLKKFLPQMIKGNWLMSYEHQPGMNYTFERLTKRVKFDNNISTAFADFMKDYDFYEKGFLIFFPEIQQLSNQFCEEYINLQNEEKL